MIAIFLLASAPSAAQPRSPAEFSQTSLQWEQLDLPAGVSSATFNDLAVDPDDASIAVLATWSGLYRTDDAGDTWERIGAPLVWGASGVIFAPGSPQRLYAWSDALYRNDTAGDSWTRLDLPSSVCGVAVAPSIASRLYAHRCASDGQPTVLRSDDAGQSWIAASTTFTLALDTLVVAPANSNVLIATSFDRTFRSADAGATWGAAAPGVYFFGRPAFDPEPPHMLYLGHWTGLLRSADAGATWQASGADREFKALVVSPYAQGEVLGGGEQAAWRVTSSEATWSAMPWSLPADPLWFRRSIDDNRVLYMRSNTALWRATLRDQSFKYGTFLPFIHVPFPADTSPLAARQALDRANHYRRLLGLIPLQSHPAIVAAAQNHANYVLLNAGDTEAQAYGAHGEVAGKPGYTGQWPSDRLKTAGFPWFGGSEVMHGIDDPISSVDGWIATVYHRIITLDPGAHYAGYGGGRNDRLAVDVLDFGSGPLDQGIWTPAAPYPLGYPFSGQTGVPFDWGGGESPDPLPPGAPHPVGYPFTLQGVNGTLHVAQAALRDSAGQLVPTHPNPPDCSTYNCYALIAVAPLRPRTTYTVHAQGTVDAQSFDRTWSFTTGIDAGIASGARP